jgi:hypothetical protein
LEILSIPLLLIGAILAVFLVIFIIQMFLYGPAEAFDNVKEGLVDTFLSIWAIITLPFTLIADLFKFIFKLFKR